MKKVQNELKFFLLYVVHYIPNSSKILICGFYCIALTDLRGDFVRVSLVSGAKFAF